MDNYFVKLRADWSGIKKDIADAKQYIERETKKVKFGINTGEFTAGIRRSISEVGRLTSSISQFTRKRFTANVDVKVRQPSGMSVNQQVQRLLSANNLGHVVAPQANFNQVLASMGQVRTQARQLNRQRVQITGVGQFGGLLGQLGNIRQQVQSLNQVRVNIRGQGGGFFAQRAGMALAGGGFGAMMTGSRLGGLGGAVGAMVGGAPGAMAGALGGAGVGMAASATAAPVMTGIGRLQSLEQYEVSLGTILRDQEKANELLRELAEIDLELPTSLDQLARAATALAGSGFNPEEISGQVITLLDAASISTAGIADGTARLTRALSQMKAAGRLSTQDVNQISELGIPARQILSEEMGMSYDKIAKKSQAGEIPIDEIITALMNGFEKRFGGSLMKMADKYGGLIERLKDKWVVFSAEIAEPIFEPLQQSLRDLLKAIDAGELDGLKEAMKSVTSAVAEMLPMMVDAAKTFSGMAESFVAIAANSPLAWIFEIRKLLMGTSIINLNERKKAVTAELQDTTEDADKTLLDGDMDGYLLHMSKMARQMGDLSVIQSNMTEATGNDPRAAKVLSDHLDNMAQFEKDHRMSAELASGSGNADAAQIFTMIADAFNQELAGTSLRNVDQEKGLAKEDEPEKTSTEKTSTETRIPRLISMEMGKLQAESGGGPLEKKAREHRMLELKDELKESESKFSTKPRSKKKIEAELEDKKKVREIFASGSKHADPAMENYANIFIASLERELSGREKFDKRNKFVADPLFSFKKMGIDAPSEFVRDSDKKPPDGIADADLPGPVTGENARQTKVVGSRKEQDQAKFDAFVADLPSKLSDFADTIGDPAIRDAFKKSQFEVVEDRDEDGRLAPSVALKELGELASRKSVERTDFGGLNSMIQANVDSQKQKELAEKSVTLLEEINKGIEKMNRKRDQMTAIVAPG